MPRSFFYKTRLHDADVARKFPFRQGLWIEDLRTPPGQECSNGSLILLAVVLWRAFFGGHDRRAAPRMAGYEAPQSENDTLFASSRKMWRTGGLHTLAKTGRRPALTIANQEQPRHDDSKEREWDRFRNRRFQRKKRRNLSPVSQIAETLCGQAHHWNRLGACSSVGRLSSLLESSLPLELHGKSRLSPVARRARVCQADAHANEARSHLRRARC
jgi:hypothetical protein